MQMSPSDHVEIPLICRYYKWEYVMQYLKEVYII